MSDCSVATGILAVVTLIHIFFTAVLAVLTYVVCSQHRKKREIVSHLTEIGTSERHHQDVQSQRRKGTTSPPADISHLSWADSGHNETESITPSSLPQGPISEVFLKSKESQDDVYRNKTVVELRKESTSSVRKMGSPFRRISTPLARISVASITSKLSRKSLDLLDSEEIGLMAPSPLDDLTDDTGEEVSCQVLTDGGSDEPDSTPPILELSTTKGRDYESEC